jgi:hypothetical protein
MVGTQTILTGWRRAIEFVQARQVWAFIAACFFIATAVGIIVLWLGDLSINWQSLVQIFGALLTPTIAIITTYIAISQWKINKTRLDLDLYDRRLAIHKAVEEFISESFASGTVDYRMTAKLRSATAEARFLFPKKIEVLLDTLHRKALRASGLRKLLYTDSGEPGIPVGERRDKVVEEESNLVQEIQGPLWEESKGLFRKYLTLA